RAADVRALQKPSVPAWAVNQLFWRSRPVYDELIARAEEIEVQAQRGELDRLQERVEDLAGRLEPVFDALRSWRSGGA
ncbi:MAG TPA: hypothetical protein VFD53_02770, partial [Ilumatobacter sp.]|nr:hypothetical protein [Ilumatobacter sp.]